jgi:RNA polymerase sigma-70 factor, ECF subfamily
MSRAAAPNVEEVLRAGALRLLARAADARSLDAEALAPRLRVVAQKYLLRDEPEAPVERIDKFLDGLRADDLCLVVACERGDERAWDDLIGGFRATVLSAARSASSSEDAAEELAQSVWAELYGLRERAGGGAAGKLAYYSGCGSLGGWLRAVVGQLAVDRHRKSARLVQTEEDADFDRLAQAQEAAGAHAGDGFQPQPAPDPEQSLARSEAVRALHGALARVLGALSDEDRLLVKLYYFDGLRLREAGAVLGVHEATASRRLTRIHAEVRERTAAALAEDYGWTQQEVARSMAEAARDLDADIGRLLTPSAAPSERHEELYE